MVDRHPLVRDARLVVVQEAGHRRRELALEVRHDAIDEIAGYGPAGSMVDRVHPRLELRSGALRYLRRQIAHPMAQTALPRRAGEAGVDRLDDPESPVRDHQQGSPRPRARRYWKKVVTVSVFSFEPAMRPSRTFFPSLVKPQAASTGSLFWPG